MPRYQVIREPDGRYTVVDYEGGHRWVYGPTTQAKARAEAKRRNRRNTEVGG